MDKQLVLQIAAMLGQMADSFGGNTSGGQLGRHATASAQSQIMAEAVKKQKEEEEKKEKGGFLGKVGSTIGGLAGVAAAPLTGGASLAATAAMGAGGAALGGAAGRGIGGADMLDPNALVTDALMGGLTGGMAYHTPNPMVGAIQGNTPATQGLPHGQIKANGMTHTFGPQGQQSAFNYAPVAMKPPAQPAAPQGFLSQFMGRLRETAPAAAYVSGLMAPASSAPRVIQDPNDPNRRLIAY